MHLGSIAHIIQRAPRSKQHQNAIMHHAMGSK
jgi:hypothetical protein